jgi:diguanylate cyclase (GGDEF)-like protein
LLEKVPDKNIKKYSVGFSIGIAMYPDHSKNFHVLLKYADIAMYHAKEGGKNAQLMYNDDMKAKDEK